MAKKASRKASKPAKAPAKKSTKKTAAAVKPAKAAGKQVSGKKGTAKQAESMKATVKTGKKRSGGKSAHQANKDPVTKKTGVPQAETAKKRAAAKAAKPKTPKAAKPKTPKAAAKRAQRPKSRSAKAGDNQSTAAETGRSSKQTPAVPPKYPKGYKIPAARIGQIRAAFKDAMARDGTRLRTKSVMSSKAPSFYSNGSDSVDKVKRAMRREAGVNIYGRRLSAGVKRHSLGADGYFGFRRGSHTLNRGKLARIAAKHGVKVPKSTFIRLPGSSRNRTKPNPKTASADAASRFAKARNTMLRVVKARAAARKAS